MFKNKYTSSGYLHVQDRFQIQIRKIEGFIEKENAMRFADAFLEYVELDKLGFEIATLKTQKADLRLIPCKTCPVQKLSCFELQVRSLKTRPNTTLKIEKKLF
jgi:hypothetical protein